MYGDQFGEFVCGYCGLRVKRPAKLRRFSGRLRESNGTTGFSSEKTSVRTHLFLGRLFQVVAHGRSYGKLFTVMSIMRSQSLSRSSNYGTLIGRILVAYERW